MIQAVFFDFGGVLGRLDRPMIADIESRYAIPSGGLLKALYGTPEWEAVQVGRRPEEEWWAAIGRKLEEMSGHPVQGIDAEWRGIWSSMDTDVVGLAERLRETYVVGVLSNSTLRLEKDLLEGNGIHDIFHVVINSARVGVAKPDARIYHHAAAAVGLDPSACLHIDDLPHNVDGAREAGFASVHYTGDYAALEASLRALGVNC
ncbi:MAG TPA: HAD family phosphatase [Dehalococcoidia bacterium]|nr:HAD family phosphatase [Dehalococcoidia bacterium]